MQRSIKDIVAGIITDEEAIAKQKIDAEKKAQKEAEALAKRKQEYESDVENNVVPVILELLGELDAELESRKVQHVSALEPKGPDQNTPGGQKNRHGPDTAWRTVEVGRVRFLKTIDGGPRWVHVGFDILSSKDVTEGEVISLKAVGSDRVDLAEHSRWPVATFTKTICNNMIDSIIESTRQSVKP